MATVRSLGLNHSPHLGCYSWKTYSLPDYYRDDIDGSVSVADDADGHLVDEELGFDDETVVWARAGVVKRVFSFGVEREAVVDAVFATFGAADDFGSGGGAGDGGSNGDGKGYKRKKKEKNNDGKKGTGSELGVKKRRKKYQTGAAEEDERDGSEPATTHTGPLGNNRSRARTLALVVILRTQAHVFFLAGDSHVVPLPFEVASVWPSPDGLVFQRKVAPEQTKLLSTVPSALPTSFAQSQLSRLSGTSKGSFKLSGLGTGGVTSSPAPHPATTVRWPLKEAGGSALPRTFSLTDPHSEMGLVVVAPNSFASEPWTGNLEALGPAEEILYVSAANEMPGVVADGPPLIIVVTLNHRTAMFTTYTARYRDNDIGLARSKKPAPSHSKRRSSYFDFGTGMTTPTARPPNVRESFGVSQSRNLSGISTQETKADETEEFASQFGQEFDDIVPSKTSRRVSSLLARADLAPNNDRTSFSDLASGTHTNRTVKRGDSFGGRNSPRVRRSSVVPSAFSAGSNFFDAPVDKFLDSLNNGGDFQGFEAMELTETISGLPKELLLSKVEGFPAGMTLPALKSTRFRVSVISNFQELSSDSESNPMAVCILNHETGALVVHCLSVRKTKKDFRIQAMGLRHGSNVLDSCKIVDGGISRMLVLTRTLDGRGELTLQAPWSTPVKVDLPKMMIHDPFNAANRRREGSSRRTFSDSPLSIVALERPTKTGKVDVVDGEGKRHRIQIQLQPKNHKVRQVLDVCKFVLAQSPGAGDGLLVGWWEVLRWLRTRDDTETDMEWTAMVVILFSMAVYFIESNSLDKAGKRRRKKELPRSSSASGIDLESWTSMLDTESGPTGAASPWMFSPAWSWVVDEETAGQGSDNVQQTTGRSNWYVIHCIVLAREFLQSPQGEAAMSAEGYLPTAICRDLETRKTALGTMLVGLHLLREEWKLSTVDAEKSCSDSGLLMPVLAQVGSWLGWTSWTWRPDAYYGVEMASIDRWVFEESTISALDIPPEPFPPPSIFSFVENSFRKETSAFPTLVDIVSAPGDKFSSHLWDKAMNIMPRTLLLTAFINDLRGTTTIAAKVELLARWRLTNGIIDTFPDGIALPLHEALANCQASPLSSWGPDLLCLLDRDDLLVSTTTGSVAPPMSRPVQLSHDATRDVHFIGSSTLDTSNVSSFEVAAEADRQSVTRLIFRDDRRYFEAVRILNQSKAPVAECPPEPDWTEQDTLEAQRELVELVMLRTLSIPAGRALLGFSVRVPLMTEKLPIPSFSPQCLMKPSNVTVSVDRASLTEEKVCWAFFHNGVATGLAISRAAKGIDTSWILYNKPGELTNRHAGFLLALGLNGHLKNLAKWVAFKYLTPKHTMTSIGLLLGLSTSYLGTMDTLITRLLSVHVTRMLPPGAAELNLSPLTQTTGIMGIGLLYCRSQHRRMSEVMLSEIENLDQEESSISGEILRDEGYRLAAGFSLGFINLGKGKDMRGLRDMHIVDRLLALAVGTKSVDVVHILDRATAGATIALAMIFMKSNDKSIARRVDIPDTTAQFDYVRPDIFLLRTLTKHLIIWDRITPSHAWVRANLPAPYRSRSRLTGIRTLSSDDMPFFYIVAGLCVAIGLRHAGTGSQAARDVLVAYLDQFIRICRLPAPAYDSRLARNAVRHCQDAIALAAASVMAGAGDLAVFRRLRALHGRVDAATPYGSHMAAHMAVGLLFLSGGTHTLGTTDLAVGALLVALYPVFPADVLDNRCHLQAFRHLWVLAAEPRCLVPRDLDSRRAVSVPISLTMRDGQTFSAVAPCLLPPLKQMSRVDIAGADYWPLVLDFSRDRRLRRKFANPVDRDDGDGSSRSWRAGSHGGTNQSIYLRRRPIHALPSTSVFAATLMALSERADVLPSMPGVRAGTESGQMIVAHANMAGGTQHASTAASASTAVSPFSLWSWLFQLPSLRHLDMTDKLRILPIPPAINASLAAFGSNAHELDADDDDLSASEAEAEAGRSSRTEADLSKERAMSVRQKRMGPSRFASMAGDHAPSWLRPSPVDARIGLEAVVEAAVVMSGAGTHQEGGGDGETKRNDWRQGSGAGVDLHRDALWQLRLLFAWLDASDADSEADSADGEHAATELQDPSSDAAIVKPPAASDNGRGAWLRRGVLEDMRWRIWAIQAGDVDVDVGVDDRGNRDVGE